MHSWAWAGGPCAEPVPDPSSVWLITGSPALTGERGGAVEGSGLHQTARAGDTRLLITKHMDRSLPVLFSRFPLKWSRWCYVEEDTGNAARTGSGWHCLLRWADSHIATYVWT